MKSTRHTSIKGAAAAGILLTILLPNASAQGFNIDTSSREAVRVFYKLVYTASEGVAHGWTGNLATCTPGTVSAAYQNATALRVNYYRAMAGMPSNITFNAAANEKAQASSLMMGANKKIDHHPTASWACYTELGREGAAGNLAQGNAGPKAIDDWIEDSGDNNRRVGHRRCLNFPPQLTMGSGHVPVGDSETINSTQWVGDPRAATRPVTREAFVADPITPRFRSPVQHHPETAISFQTLELLFGAA